MIAEMLGVPREDWQLLFRWTNEIIAPQDPEFQREGTPQETLDRRAHRALRLLQRDVGASAAKQPRTTS